jgi:hypothetical protein
VEGAMSKFIGAVKAGLKAAVRGAEPSRYEAAGFRVTCPHCKNVTFHTHEALLNTSGATFMRLDWLDESGTALICANCGLIQWFAAAPEEIEE